MVTRSSIIAFGTLLLLVSAAPAHADKCTRAKLRAIGKREVELLGCHQRATTRGDATLIGPCLEKVEARYTAAFAKAGACGGDLAACQCLADKCAMSVRVALPEPGPSSCEAARLKAAAMRAAAKLLCNANAATAGVPVSPACIGRAEARYLTSFAKAAGCGGDQGNVATKVDQQCVGGVGGDPLGGATVGAICASSCMPCGTFVTKWGSAGTGDGQFDHPFKTDVDGSGNVLVADAGNNRIQKFTNDGTFITKWGSLGTGDGQFNYPIAFAIDPNGNIFVGDTGNHRMQKFTADGTFITKWGSAGLGDGQFSDAFLGPAVDPSGNVFTVEQDSHRIQKFTNDGMFITKWGSLGTGDGQFVSLSSAVVDTNGNVFTADDDARLGFRVQKFTNDGMFITKWGSRGSLDGQFDASVVVTVDRRDNTVYVTELNNRRIQKFTNEGAFLTKWGSAGTGDGQFSRSIGISVDANGNVFVSDGAEPSEVAPIHNRIQKFACP